MTDTNLGRVVDVFVDELDLVNLDFEGAIPADTGRPAYHPAVLLKIYIYGYLNRIQSSRRLEREAQHNVELMWLSLTDPQALWTAAPGGPAFYAYSTNYLIDTKHGVIVDVEPTPAHRPAEVESTKTMIGRVEEQYNIKPERLIGDTAYGTAPMLVWMVDVNMPLSMSTIASTDGNDGCPTIRLSEASKFSCQMGSITS